MLRVVLVAVALAALAAGGARAAAVDDVDFEEMMAAAMRTAMRAPGNVTEHYIVHEGRNRSFVLYTPTTYRAGAPTPLVTTVHFFVGQPEIMQIFTYMNDVAEEKGFLVMYPRGTYRSFNAGPVCCGPDDRDDVLFIRKCVDETKRLRSVDPIRVYVTGMSNGGYMSHRLGCDASDVFAAIAPVAGSSPWPVSDFPALCNPPRAIPSLSLHGTNDLLVPYDGMIQTVDYWLVKNGCAKTSVVTYQNGRTTCESYTSGCRPQPNGQRTNVTVCTSVGSRHWYWPSSPITRGDDIDASREIWRFFTGYTL